MTDDLPSFNEDETPARDELVELSPVQERIESKDPTDTPLTERVIEPKIPKQRDYIIWGLGGLFVIAMLLTVGSVLLNPTLAPFFQNFLQVTIGGLIGLGGTVVGFLFGKSSSN